ncbi:protein kinase [Blastochloris sulfoviridis]|uniref:Protein kinase n=2 Tax=Blastochloris sulfoviridis TaxID=50712 RepID=A0A5M6HT43_9HYPH|nr:protein kinase [Blastochloris sulfoviridis]
MVRRCPNCGSDRQVSELFCDNLHHGAPCQWPLASEAIREKGTPVEETPVPPAVPAGLAAALRRCVNGHVMDAGDEICLACGADPAPAAAPADDLADDAADEAPLGAIAGWSLLRRRPAALAEPPYACFEARGPDGRMVLATLYQLGAEPDPTVHDVLRRMPLDHIPELIETGRHDGRAYEVTELIAGGTLADAGFAGSTDPARLRRIVDELGRALAGFAEVGLRHRDINPRTVCVRTAEPLDLLVTSFGSARLSDFDLESVAPLELTRYSAPEAIVGAVSAASDWWSLGMIVLEQATAGRCFDGVDDQAFRLHVVTRGVPLPEDLDPDVRLLLRGLLARDPLKRWSAAQVRAWLDGEAVEAPDSPATDAEPAGPGLALAGRVYTRPDAFALAAAEAGNWDAARDLLLRGAVATWLEACRFDPKRVSLVRRIGADERLAEDFRHALALLALNPALPLTVRGEIVTPAWLLAHPAEGYDIITGEVTHHLERMEREPWLVRLRARAEAVRERAKILDIVLDEERVRVAMLASSRANLEAERDAIRQVFPDTDHAGLASIVERGRLSDEDLIILVGAATGQFLPIANLVSTAGELAAGMGVAFDAPAASALLVRPRREIFGLVDGRTANFARCGIPRIDEWADIFRVERRLPLPRAVILLLTVPADAWREPPKQQYVATLLAHLEKRVSGTVSRGPLARFTIGKTTPRVDLFELGTALRPAEALLNHILSRAEVPVPLDPAGYLADENRESRFRRLINHAETFRRDTGLDGRTLGFPFLVVRDGGRVDGEREARPRVAPVLLWPVDIKLPVGASAATIAFDGEREEVRLNPALEGILGAGAFQTWQAARNELLGRASLRVGEVIDAFGVLAAPRSRELDRLPSKDAKVPPGTFELVCAAALFNAEFTGQSVAADLRQMARMPPTGTGLDAALRIAPEPPVPQPLAPVRERDRFVIVESDPSQDAAILRGRAAPGLLVEGPPGTGKSQTIVNVVADAIGRGETVLVVCQKQAALKVVQKRLDAEGLGDRLFHVVDANRDREAIVRALRDQLGAARAASAVRVAGLKRQREDAAARIETLEGEIDRHHQAFHLVDDITGLSYRDLLAALIGLEAQGTVVDAPGLRPLFQALGRGRMAAIEEVCSSLARLWLDAAFEDSPLEVLRPFSADASVAQAFKADLSAFIKAEVARRDGLAATTGAFDVDEPEAHAAWLAANGAMLEGMPDLTRQGLAAWLDLFRPNLDGKAPGIEAIRTLETVEAELRALDPAHHDAALFAPAAALAPAALQALYAAAHRAAAPASFFGRLNPARWSARRRCRTFLAGLGDATDDTRMARLRDALGLERNLRPLRAQVEEVRATLRLASPEQPPALAALARDAAAILGTLRQVAPVAEAVLACPRPEAATAVARAGTPGGFVALRHAFETAFARHAARARSGTALVALESWFSPSWLEEMQRRIQRNEDSTDSLASVVGALGSLEAYQRFRTRAAGLDADVLQVFRVLRPKEAALRALAPSDLDGVVRRTLQREALLAWKGRLEAARPDLLFEREEIARKIEVLAALDREFRTINRELLRHDLDPARLGSILAWDGITRLRGPRARRLRQILDEGADLGLMRLRPIWLMNPDVVSRVLPLKAGLFDLVVYDEASQMPVEHAMPSLFRAKRILVAGDEKQMPPTSFFSGRIDDDEDDGAEIDGLDEGLTAAEREAQEESWNRREVKDCPDLLQLARGVLPTAILQIHYRSKYRELIGYSNAAFYKGDLSVPARHPEAEVRRVRPVEVIRADGVYEGQTNVAEAERVVAWLAETWAAPDEPPSIGVVTFNRKQADLIEDLLEKRAEADPGFLQAYRRERDRTQNREDMGFFVKNVENVQGDERDVIVFSTTFGRDRHGAFRRNFGVLGQAGGERRLNVAVTRARAKVVLITSMPVGDVSDWLASGRAPGKPRDYLQAYLDYAARLSAGDIDAARRSAARLSPRLSSPRHGVAAQDGDGFVDSIETYLRELGYDPVPAAEGDAFGLDFAVEDPRTGLFGIGIECDAPRHGLLERARAREIWRPDVLRRAIPVVHRVSSHAWYHRPDDERRRLGAALRAALG